MTKEGDTHSQDLEWLRHVCCGNESAADFLMLFFWSCHLWDDLIDKDVKRTEEQINKAFWNILVEMPRNRYYRAFQDEIQPLIAVCIQEWLAANKLEGGNRQDIAYTLRCSIVALIHQAAEFCGGYEWACQVGEEIRLRAQHETFDEYVAKLNA